MEPTPQERRQVFWVFAGVGVFTAVTWTLVAWARGSSLAAAVFGGVIFGLIFAPALHFGFKRMGIYAPKGKSRHSCDVCAQPLPIFRRPTTFRQAFWGGWTCPNCGTELDRRDRPIQPG